MKISSLPKGLFGLALHQRKGGLDLFRGVAPAHAPAAAAGGSLQNHREAEADGLFQRLVPVLQGLGAAGMMGTPQEMAMDLAANLSPMLASTSAGGPTKVMPAASQARAKSAFSDRKP